MARGSEGAHLEVLEEVMTSRALERELVAGFTPTGWRPMNVGTDERPSEAREAKGAWLPKPALQFMDSTSLL